jgi:hypothetical protein
MLPLPYSAVHVVRSKSSLQSALKARRPGRLSTSENGLQQHLQDKSRAPFCPQLPPQEIAGRCDESALQDLAASWPEPPSGLLRRIGLQPPGVRLLRDCCHWLRESCSRRLPGALIEILPWRSSLLPDIDWCIEKRGLGLKVTHISY